MSTSGPAGLAIAPIDLTGPLGRDLLADMRRVHGPSIDSVVRYFGRVFCLQAPDAEHLSFVGAQVEAPHRDADGSARRFSVGGTGQTLEAAFNGCIAEGLELLSQFEAEGDIACTRTLADMRPGLDDSTTAWIEAHQPLADHLPIDWVLGTDLSDGSPRHLPADLCLRREPAPHRLVPRAPLSIGCAAGRSASEAQLRAVLELIERDAVALWWQGGRPARPLAPEHPAALAGRLGLEQLRGSAGGRKSWLLDISTEFGVTVLASISVRGDGRGMACGMAARLRAEEAAEAAVREMMQVELAYAVAATKLAQAGAAALSAADRRHLDRARIIDATACELIHPRGAPRGAEDVPAAQSLADVVRNLADRGIRSVGINLTRPAFALPVSRIVAPALQTSGDSPQTERLVATLGAYGGGQQTHGIDLF